jgi:chromosomal replication initiation ATPase DnaA
MQNDSALTVDGMMRTYKRLHPPPKAPVVLRSSVTNSAFVRQETVDALISEIAELRRDMGSMRAQLVVQQMRAQQIVVDSAELRSIFTQRITRLAARRNANKNVIKSVVQVICNLSQDVTAKEVYSHIRRAEVVCARHTAMYVARHCFGFGSTVIGGAFDRDHSSVLHALRQVDKNRSLFEPLLSKAMEMFLPDADNGERLK